MSPEITLKKIDHRINPDGRFFTFPIILEYHVDKSADFYKYRREYN